ncbi:hypothetical protein KR074_009145 [Drosophila pseudoananassae]|nr:hypothetical protein KR074_009145 [Drosophila pseudoananassae]
MRSAILFGLIACLAVSLVMALEDSPRQSNDLSSLEQEIGQAVHTQERSKRQIGFGYGAPFYGGGPYYGGGFRGPYGGYGGYRGYGGYGGYGGFRRHHHGGFYG